MSARGARVARETILVVDDEAGLRRVVELTLSGSGYKVLTASHGLEGLNIVRKDAEKTIRMVVTDLLMPKMSGAEFIEALNSERPDIRILLTTGSSDGVLKNHRELLKGISFLRKPFSLKELRTAIADLRRASRSSEPTD
ncbi:MAG: response regulator [Elusimicrobiota bacterium]